MFQIKNPQHERPTFIIGDECGNTYESGPFDTFGEAVENCQDWCTENGEPAAYIYVTCAKYTVPRSRTGITIIDLPTIV